MSKSLDRSCRNVTFDGRRTSLRLENVFWDSLIEICDREHSTLDDLVGRISRTDEEEQGNDACLARAVRVYIIEYYRHAATEEGHWRAGHNRGDSSMMELSSSGRHQDVGRQHSWQLPQRLDVRKSLS